MSRPYPRYGDSGVEWLGDVPEHWEVTRISAAARGGADSFTDGDWVELPYITDGGVRLIQTGNVGVGLYREQGFRYIDESSFDELRCTEVDPGDVLICRLADPVGRACLAPDLGVRMITSVDVCILKPSARFSAQFLIFLLSSKRYLGYIESLVRGGTRDRISRSMLGAIKIPSPPAREQLAIAAFLDRETERIDALVAKKRRLVERLREYRTALITRTVTRGLPPEAARAAGLDPSPRLKSSEVEWLGDVPDHWKIKRLKHVAHVRYGLGEPPPEDPDGPPIIRATNVKEGKIHTEGLLHVCAEAVPGGRNAFLTAGEIIVVRSGAYTGDSAIIPSEYEGSVAGYDIVVRVVYGNPQYVSWQLLGRTVLNAQFHLRSMRAAQPHLNAEDIEEAWIACPPLHEQEVLSDYLAGADSQIAAAVDQTTKVIERLQEYRTALVTSAVTGKIDVRDAAREPVAATTR